MRVNRGQQPVIGGYTHGAKTFDAFTLATRVALLKKLKPLEITRCAARMTAVRR
jgi:hypothetical protein